MNYDEYNIIDQDTTVMLKNHKYFSHGYCIFADCISEGFSDFKEQYDQERTFDLALPNMVNLYTVYFRASK